MRRQCRKNTPSFAGLIDVTQCGEALYISTNRSKKSPSLGITHAGCPKEHLSTPEPTRHRAHVHARERRRMLLDLKTSRRHATNGLFGVQNANGSSCSSPNVVRLRGQAQKTEYFNDILSVKVAPVMLKLDQRDHALAAHRLADHRKGILPDLAVRCDVVRAVEISLVTMAHRQRGASANASRFCGREHAR